MGGSTLNLALKYLTGVEMARNEKRTSLQHGHLVTPIIIIIIIIIIINIIVTHAD
jgi:hypothetical protein